MILRTRLFFFLVLSVRCHDDAVTQYKGHLRDMVKAANVNSYPQNVSVKRIINPADLWQYFVTTVVPAFGKSDSTGMVTSRNALAEPNIARRLRGPRRMSEKRSIFSDLAV